MRNIYQQAARYTFKVKEGGPDSTSHIAIEPYGDSIDFLKNNNAQLCIELHPGTTLERAYEIAEFMNRNIMALGCFRLG